MNKSSILVNMSEEEKIQLQERASALGIGVNAYIRLVCKNSDIKIIKTNDLTEFTCEIALLRKKVEAILYIAQLEKMVTERDIKQIKEILDDIDNRCADVQKETFNIRKKEKRAI